MITVLQRSLWVVIAAVAGCLWFIAPRAEAVVEPDIVSTTWQLDIEYDQPGFIFVQPSGRSQPELYWYMTYTVTNRTGEEQNFVPEIWLLTDDGDLMQANRGISPTVFHRIKDHVDNPLLESPARIVGKILIGRDNARDGVAIWKVPDHDVNAVTIFFGGLSGETKQIVRVTDAGDTALSQGELVSLDQVEEANDRIRVLNNRARDENPGITDDQLQKLAQVDELPILVRKTLEVTYQTPGDYASQPRKPFRKKSQRWIMR